MFVLTKVFSTRDVDSTSDSQSAGAPVRVDSTHSKSILDQTKSPVNINEGGSVVFSQSAAFDHSESVCVVRLFTHTSN